MTTAALKKRPEVLKASTLTGNVYVLPNPACKTHKLKQAGEQARVMYEVSKGEHCDCLAEFFNDIDGQPCGVRLTAPDG